VLSLTLKLDLRGKREERRGWIEHCRREWEKERDWGRSDKGG